MNREIQLQLYQDFIINCTPNATSVANYSDFKRINECLGLLFPEKQGISVLDFDNPVEFESIIDELSKQKQFIEYEKKGRKQYSNTLKHYLRFLFAKRMFSESSNLLIVNDGLKDSYRIEELANILKDFRVQYYKDGLKNNACDVAFGIKYGKFLERGDTKEIANAASGDSDSDNTRDGYFIKIGVSTFQAIEKEKYGLSFWKHNEKAFCDNTNNRQPLQQIFYGAPGTGKSHRIKEIIKEHVNDEKEQVIRTTFHPDSDYSTFVGCYKPIMKSVPQTYVVEGNEKPVMADKDNQATKDEIVYDYTPQAFVQAYTKAWTTNKPVILVIEEINRGNCAQIFGDIFQLLDRGDDGVSEYEIKPDKALENYLEEYFATFDDLDEQIKSGKIMKLPSNLYIWATMNTSDQSLFPIDSAFKRRWEWKYMPINNHEDKGYQIEIGNAKYDWWGFLARINHVINDATNSEDKKLGYFFAKAQGKTIDAEQFVGKVLFYLWNDVFKSYGFDDPIFSKGDNKKFEFSDFFMNDGHPNTDTVNLFLRKLEETIKMEELPMEIKPNLQDDGQGE